MTRWFQFAAFFVAAILITLTQSPVVQADGEVFEGKIVFKLAQLRQFEPDVHGDWIVFVVEISEPLKNREIVGYHVGDERFVEFTDQGRFAANPTVDGDVVAWQVDPEGMDMEIFFQNVNQEDKDRQPLTGSRTLVRVTDDDRNDVNPHLQGNWLVWKKEPLSGQDDEIWAKDVSSNDPPFMLMQAGADELFKGPRVYGDRVVFEVAGGSDPGIHLYDIGSSTERTLVSGAMRNPDIWDDIVVFEDWSNELQQEGADIYYVKAGGGSVTHVFGKAFSNNCVKPQVHEGNIVYNCYEGYDFERERDDNEVAMQHIDELETQHQLSDHRDDQRAASIGGRYVAYEDNRDGDYIYFVDLGLDRLTTILIWVAAIAGVLVIAGVAYYVVVIRGGREKKKPAKNSEPANKKASGKAEEETSDEDDEPDDEDGPSQKKTSGDRTRKKGKPVQY